MFKKIEAEELAKFIQPLTHTVRVQIIEELRTGELSVSSIQKIVEIPQASVSQHLAILKSHHLIKERKDGRRVFYSLVSPELAGWLLKGMEFIVKNETLDAINFQKETCPA